MSHLTGNAPIDEVNPMLKRVIIPLTLIMLGGCVAKPVTPPKPSLVDGNGLPPTAVINHLAQRIVT